jgi:hypothetical protein
MSVAPAITMSVVGMVAVTVELLALAVVVVAQLTFGATDSLLLIDCCKVV